jgi:hypothetical protein
MVINPVRWIGSALAILGLLLMGLGGATWFMVQNEIAGQRIVVSADTPFLNALTAGKVVNGPLDAMAQAQAILLHSAHGDPDLTYAALGEQISQAEAVGDDAKVEELTAQRETLMNASFLRASLFTSVMAFGVSLLVLGVGFIAGLTGLALVNLSRSKEDSPPATV